MTKPTIFSEETKQLIFKMYAEGLGSQTIGMRLKTSASAVHTLIKRGGLMRERKASLKARTLLGPLCPGLTQPPTKK